MSNLQLLVRQANGVDERVDLDFGLQGDERDVVEEGPGVEVAMQVDPLDLVTKGKPLSRVLTFLRLNVEPLMNFE